MYNNIITEKFEFNYLDLQRPGFLSKAGQKNGLIRTETIASVSKGGTNNCTITVNTSAPFTTVTGDKYFIKGISSSTVDDSIINKEHTITNVDADTFTFTIEGTTDPGTLTLMSNTEVRGEAIFGADNQVIMTRIPRGALLQVAGLAYIEQSAGVTDLEFFCHNVDANGRASPTFTNSNFAIFGDSNADARQAGYSLIVNNGTAYTQTLSSFITNSITGLDGVNTGTDAEKGALIAGVMHTNRNNKVQERSYEAFGAASSSSDYLALQVNGSIADLTAGRWIAYFQMFDPIGLANGGRPEGLE